MSHSREVKPSGWLYLTMIKLKYDLKTLSLFALSILLHKTVVESNIIFSDCQVVLFKDVLIYRKEEDYLVFIFYDSFILPFGLHCYTTSQIFAKI